MEPGASSVGASAVGMGGNENNLVATMLQVQPLTGAITGGTAPNVQNILYADHIAVTATYPQASIAFSGGISVRGQ